MKRLLSLLTPVVLVISSTFISTRIFSQSDTLSYSKYAFGIGYQYYVPKSETNNHPLQLPKIKYCFSHISKELYKFEFNTGIYYHKTINNNDNSYYDIDDHASTLSISIGSSIVKQFKFNSLLFDIGITGEWGYSREKYITKTNYTYSTSWTNRKDTYLDGRLALIGTIEYQINKRVSIFATGGLGANMTKFSTQNFNYYSNEIGFSYYNLFGLRYNFNSLLTHNN